MKTITLILNWLVVCVFCKASHMGFNVGLDYACSLEALEGMSLPSITNFCYYNMWILWTVPLVWGIATIFLFARKNTSEKTYLHTSASVFLGLFLFFTYALASVLPLIKIANGGIDYF